MERDDQRARSKPFGAIVALVLLAAIPFLLLGLALLEESLLGTANLSAVYRDLGILRPLKALYKSLP